MSDITNQKELREFCNLSGCEVWKAIQKLEEARTEHDGARPHEPPYTIQPERTTLRRHCAERCWAYRFAKHLDTANKKIVDREGAERYR